VFKIHTVSDGRIINIDCDLVRSCGDQGTKKGFTDKVVVLDEESTLTFIFFIEEVVQFFIVTDGSGNSGVINNGTLNRGYILVGDVFQFKHAVVVLLLIDGQENDRVRDDKRNDNAENIHNKKLIMQLHVIEKFGQKLSDQGFITLPLIILYIITEKD
jgi:hypothetical protein